MPLKPLSKGNKRRVLVYGGIVSIAWGFWVYQPLEFTLFPKAPPQARTVQDPDSKRLFAKGAKVLVITAHPDDSEFFCGGTLLRLADAGAALDHLVITDGDKGYYPWEDAVKNRRIRRAEQTQASKTWNAREIHFLGFPDGRLRARDDVIDQVAAHISRLQPEYILAFDNEYPPRISHQDHRRAGDIAIRAAKKSGCAKWLLLYSTMAPNYTVDVSRFWGARERLPATHKSQFSGKRLEIVTGSIAEAAMAEGEKAGIAFGESFRCLKLR